MKLSIKNTWKLKLQLSDKTKSVIDLPKGYSIVVEYNVSTPDLVGEIGEIDNDEELNANTKLINICKCICHTIYLVDSKKNEDILEVDTNDGTTVSGSDVIAHIPITLIDDIATGFFSKPSNSK